MDKPHDSKFTSVVQNRFLLGHRFKLTMKSHDQIMLIYIFQHAYTENYGLIKLLQNEITRNLKK